MESHSDPTSVPHVPRLMALCREVYDRDGYEIGAHALAWALTLPDGWTVTLPATGEPSVRIWPSVQEAARSLTRSSTGPPRSKIPPRLNPHQ